MNYPEYRHIHQRIKCPKIRVNVNSVSIYKYNSEKNTYQLIERTCDIERRYNTAFVCNGTNNGNPCYIVNPPPLELPPTSPDFD